MGAVTLSKPLLYCAPMEGVTGTATHFILKKYKEKHLIFPVQEEQEERFVLE